MQSTVHPVSINLLSSPVMFDYGTKLNTYYTLDLIFGHFSTIDFVVRPAQLPN